MGASTGPILAAGGLSLLSTTVAGTSTVETKMRIVVAAGIAAAGLALAERAAPRVAVALAWSALITTFFIPTGPPGSSPIEVFQRWYSRR